MHSPTSYVDRRGTEESDVANPEGSHSLTGFGVGRCTRRSFTGFLAAAALLPLVGRAAADPLEDLAGSFGFSPDRKYPLFDEATAKVIPLAGFQSRIALKDSVIKLAQYGVIDRGKFFALGQRNGNMPIELSRVLSEPSDKPILLTRDNASFYVDLLWPVGLANHMVANVDSPIAGRSLSNFASTAGWILGAADEGARYFNKYTVVDMTPATQALTVRVAKSAFRPCCNNSTFFQDCNHGSALLGVLQLGAAQGLLEEELYREALAFNSFWFPDYYIRTALYFKVARNTEWHEVDPKLVMGSDFSALDSWRTNVQDQLENMPNLIPEARGDSNCGS